MDELDLFREFRRGVATPTGDAKRRASDQLANAIDARHGRGASVLHAIRKRPGRTAFAAAALVGASAAALFVSTPWKGSPGFLDRAQAALTPPAGTILHMKYEETTSSTEFSCTVTRGPNEVWIDQTQPHRFRLLSEVPLDPTKTDLRTVVCSSGTPSELGGMLDTGRR